MAVHGQNSWQYVARDIMTKTALQCKERWIELRQMEMNDNQMYGIQETGYTPSSNSLQQHAMMDTTSMFRHSNSNRRP